MSQPVLMVTVGGVTFYGGLPPTGYGFTISPDGFEGFDDGVAAKADVVSRPNADGDFDVPAFLDSRIVSLSGFCVAENSGRLALFGSALKGALASGPGTVVVNHLGRTMFGSARLAPGSATKFKVDGNGGRDAEFQIQLKFANPRLFGEGRTFASGAPAYHFGNFTASPVFTVTGSMPSGYTISGAGRTFATSKPLVSGVPHVVDMSTGYLTINGVVQTGVVTSGDTWGVPAGVSVVNTLTGSGSGVLSARVFDTFI